MNKIHNFSLRVLQQITLCLYKWKGLMKLEAVSRYKILWTLDLKKS